MLPIDDIINTIATWHAITQVVTMETYFREKKGVEMEPEDKDPEKKSETLENKENEVKHPELQIS